MNIDPPLRCFGEENLINGFQRPYITPNAWVAALEKTDAELIVEWEEAQTIGSIVLSFDTDWDYAMETSLLGHAENVMPFVIRNYSIIDQNGRLIHHQEGNHQTRNVIHFATPVTTDKLVIRLIKPTINVPIAIFSICCYPPN